MPAQRYKTGDYLGQESNGCFCNVLFRSFPLSWKEVGRKKTFQEIQRERQQSRKLSSLLGQLPQGTFFANLGVSAAITVEHAASRYALVVMQKRPDFGDRGPIKTLKLVSGYRYAGTLPCDQIAAEIRDEVLLWNGKGYANVLAMLQPQIAAPTYLAALQGYSSLRQSESAMHFISTRPPIASRLSNALSLGSTQKHLGRLTTPRRKEISPLPPFAMACVCWR